VATANNHVLDYDQPGLKETHQVRREGGALRVWRLRLNGVVTANNELDYYGQSGL
jgi:hypothetical protein